MDWVVGQFDFALKGMGFSPSGRGSKQQRALTREGAIFKLTAIPDRLWETL
jgi:hypothetical protein